MPKNLLDGLSAAFPPDRLSPQALLELVARLTERVETLTATVERLEQAAQEAPRAAAATAESLSALLERVDGLQPLLALVERAGTTLPPVLDALEALSRRLREEGMEPEEVLAGGAAAALRLAARLQPGQLASLEALLSPASLDALARLGRSLAAGAENPPPPLGLVGLLRSATDPHVQRALGFLVVVARELGQALDEPRR